MAPLTQAPLITILNRDSHLFDTLEGVVSTSGAADAFMPVVLNASGLIDPTTLGTGETATAGEVISSGSLVNLYFVGSQLTVRLASAADVTKPAVGFVTQNVGPSDPVTVQLSGRYVYEDNASEFSSSDLDKEVYLSAADPGHVTLIAPSGPGNADQIVGYVVSFTTGTPNLVGIAFGTGIRDFSQIDGICQIFQGGTGADLSATGGANNFVKQSGAGVALTVGIIALADLPTQTGSGSIVLATSPTVTNIIINQAANGDNAIFGNRFTDSAPTGNLMYFKNAANNSDLWKVDVSGTLQVGIVPDARISYANEAQNKVLVAPVGSTGVPTFRLLAAADIPTLPDSKISYASEAQHTVFAAPSGGAGAPTYRLLIASDIPDLTGIYATIDGSADFLGFNSAVPPTAVHSIPAYSGQGLYRVSWYLVKTAIDGASSDVQVTIGWTDVTNTVQSVVGADLNIDAVGEFDSGVMTIYATNATDISASTTYTSPSYGSPMEYDLYVRVEAI